jgi:hypothetical protein
MGRFDKHRLGVAVGVIGVVLAAPRLAPADTPTTPAAAAAAPAGNTPDYFAPKPHGAVRVRVARERCRADKLLIGGLLAGTGLFAVSGVYFHLDSRAAAEEVSADNPTGQRWSDELADTYDRGQRSATIAKVSYALAGAAAVATLIAVWLTDPGEELVEARVGATVVDDGGIVGAAWQF